MLPEIKWLGFRRGRGKGEKVKGCVIKVHYMHVWEYHSGPPFV
jgi:hypothetical protein